MGEYQCTNCNETFWLDEPPWDGDEVCDACRAALSERVAGLSSERVARVMR